MFHAPMLLLALILAMSPLHAAQPTAAAGPRMPSEVEINGIEFVHVPEGQFSYTVEMDIRQERGPADPVYRDVRIWLDGYYIAKYEARARDLVRFLNSGQADPEILKKLHEGKHGSNEHLCTIKRERNGRYRESEPGRDLPAADLSWALAADFSRWMGFRLPRESEWQKAARGTERRIWPWGDFVADDTYGVFGWTEDCAPAPVSAFPKGRSVYGAYNMAGNVGEFVADWYSAEFDASLRDSMRNPPIAHEGSPLPHDTPKRLAKGGRWSRDLIGHSIAERRRVAPFTTQNRDGVRFAIDESLVLDLLSRGKAKVISPSTIHSRP